MVSESRNKRVKIELELPDWAPHLWHHFVGALLVACVIVILKHLYVLDRVKVITLNALGVAHAAYSSDSKAPNPLSKNIVMLNIGQDAYDTVFNQSSPLNRCTLAEFLEELATYNPVVLAIDLDLSPNPSGMEVCDTRLSRVLKDKFTSTELVLVVPEPLSAASEAGIRTKAEWMKDLLEAPHIHFGFPEIYSFDGMVLKHFAAPTSFAGVICNRIKEPGSSETCLRPDKIDDDSTLNRILVSEHSGLGAWQNKGEDSLEWLSLLLNRPWRETSQDIITAKQYAKNLNFNYINHRKDLIAHVEFQGDGLRLGSGTVESLSTFPAKVVFLGGDYGAGDFYTTIEGVKSGLYLHYAALYSFLNPVNDRKYWEPFLLEIVFGTLLGMLLGFLLGSPCAHYTLFRIGVVFVVCLYAVFLGVVALVFLKYFEIWINPAPLVFGVTIEKLIGYIQGEGHAAEHTENIADADAPITFTEKLLNKQIPVVLYGVVVLAAVYILMMDIFF